MRLFLSLLILTGLSLATDVFAECVVDSSTPTFINGKRIDLRCNTSGQLITSGSGGGGSGDASAAKQDEQTAILTTMDADTGNIASGIGATGDAAATQGSTGSISAKLRTVTSQLNSIFSTGIPITGTVTVGSHAVTNAGTFAVQVDGNALTSLQLIDDGIATTGSAITSKGMAAAGTDGTNARILKTDASGELQVDVLSSALPSGASTAAKQPALGTAGSASSDVITVQGIASMTPIRATLYDSSNNEVVIATGGLTSYTAAGASTNATSVKGSAGTVYGYSLSNTTTTVYYLRMYNLSSAPTCSSSTGYVATIPIPPAASSGLVGGREIQKNIGQAFTTGVGFCITGGSGSTDNTNAASGVFVEILYK